MKKIQFFPEERIPPESCKLSKVDSVWEKFIFKIKVEIFQVEQRELHF